MDIITTIMDGNEYLIVNEKIINNINYLLLINTNNKNDYIIRKEINGELIGLDNEEEFYQIINNFLIKEGELNECKTN